MTWRCCATAGCADSSMAAMPPRPSGSFCGRSGSATSAAGRGRVPVLVRARRTNLADRRDRRLCTGRRGRHDRRGARLCQSGLGLRLLGCAGLNALLASVSTSTAAPVIVAQRLRKGCCGSARGAARLVTDALATLRRLRLHEPGRSQPPRTLLRADSAFCGSAVVSAALRAGADVSITVRLDPKVKAAIASIADNAWTGMYPDAVLDETAEAWIFRAEVVEIGSLPSAAATRPSRCPAGWSCAAP